jgi:hypothetical protein
LGSNQSPSPRQVIPYYSETASGAFLAKPGLPKVEYFCLCPAATSN